MINPTRVIQTPNGTYFEGVCLSTDVKPVAGYANGCVLTELNLSSGTVKTYVLDAANAQWVEVADKQNELPAVATADKGKFLHANESTGALEWAEASGGGSGDGVLIVHNVYADGSTRLDATYAEIAAAPMVFLESVYIDMGLEMDYSTFSPLLLCGLDQGYRAVTFVKFSLSNGSPSLILYSASSDSDYPVLDT